MKKVIIAGIMMLAGFSNIKAQTAWSINGNAGTYDGTNFIGTTDNVPLNFKANGQRAGRMDNNLYHTSYGIGAGIHSINYNISAFGQNALYTNTSGNANSAFGAYALTSNSTGGLNTAVGSVALYYATAAEGNTAIGMGSLLNTTTGGYNTASGIYSSGQNYTGYGNASYGGYSNIFGNSDYNTAVGYYSLYSGGSYNNTCLGAFANLNSTSITNAIALGANTIVNASNKCRIGDANMGITECQNGIYTVSDGRFKNKISESDVKGLEFIKLLRPVVYNFDTKAFTEFLTKNMPDSVKKNYLQKDFRTSSSNRQTGFIAQEVEKAAEKSGFNFNGIHTPVDENDNYSINYGQFVVPLVKGMQEQQQIIEQQQQTIQDLLKRIEALETKSNGTGKVETKTGIGQINSVTEVSMEQNEPNPFTNETVVKYFLPQTVANAFMVVYDLSGKQLLSFPITQKGNYSVAITSEKLAAGIYIYSIIADGKIVDSKRMIVTEK